MEFRLLRFGYRLHFSLEKVQEVTGVNSQIDANTHFLMWDFDNIPYPVVYDSLGFIQKIFGLPPIHILSTGNKGGYHAYCFKGCSFIDARAIIASTPNVDKHYLAVGIGRGYFTLRFSDVEGRKFEHAGVLESKIPADVDYSDVNSFVKYTKKG